MRIQIGDTVILTDGTNKIGIVERRQGDEMSIRFPNLDNKRERHMRGNVRTLAEAMAEARRKGVKYKNTLSLTGESTLAELVSEFGYSTRQMRNGSLNKVVAQLNRAGLDVQPETDGWGRSDRFKLVLSTPVTVAAVAMEEEDAVSPAIPAVALPEPFWPTALGLAPDRELLFLRSLAGAAPILCILHLPDDASMLRWIQALWEGVTATAFQAAQRFRWKRANGESQPSVRVGSSVMLQIYLENSVLNAEAPRLLDALYSLNLITIKSEAELPVDFQRLCAIWPGPVFKFAPEPSTSNNGDISEDVRSLLKLFLQMGGSKDEAYDGLCPLKTFLWSKESAAQILARASLNLGELFAAKDLAKYKGSNENGAALALKAHLARWIQNRHEDAILRFEENQVHQVDEVGELVSLTRVDLFVEGQGRFEIETMSGAGPMEAFYHRKVLSRARKDGTPSFFVLPNEALLWAGPYLADLGYHLGDSGSILIPTADEGYFKIQGVRLNVEELEIPWDQLNAGNAINRGQKARVETVVRLQDVAGYAEIRDRIDELIIWPEKHRKAVRRPSRSSGILFFGPPGCGKSRLAQAIAGELEQEVRLLSPSDLRGPYLGWGQIMIREQFNWVAESERRMLVIDEIDAVGRRRDLGNTHTDEMANVNELLVQLDRASRLGRLIVGTTNYMDSLDEAVVRSGRFGRFIPVGPPNIEEALSILEYYLQLFVNDVDSEAQPRVEVPTGDRIRSILEPIYVENVLEERFFCGADLEEAVNRTYQRCLRHTLKGTWPDSYASVRIVLSVEELERSLREVPRSVTQSAMQRFLDDTTRYCGAGVASEYMHSLRLSEAVAYS